MPFELANVVPWGRSFEEYVAMFALSDADLGGCILGCGDGPAAFNVTAYESGHRVISADPLYGLLPAQVRDRIEATSAQIIAQTRANADEFVWSHFQSVEQMIAERMMAMRAFLADFPTGLRHGRYIDASLPHMPFGDGEFDLALCSHLLFLYSAQYDADFHRDSILELCRISREVRIFPLLELGARPSRHVPQVTAQLRDRGLRIERVRVAYEFQKGGNEMLRITQRT